MQECWYLRPALKDRNGNLGMDNVKSSKNLKFAANKEAQAFYSVMALGTRWRNVRQHSRFGSPETSVVAENE